MFYCVAIVTRLRGADWPWQVVAPGMVEVATLAGVTALICFTAGLWPAYGFLTPIVVFTIALGGVMSLHFIPAF